jgi:hypothetical protein
VNSGGVVLNATITNVTNAGGSDGGVDITVSGGSPPYTFSWDNGTFTEDVSNLTAGDYCVTVVDETGCTATDCFTVTEPCAPPVLTLTGTDVSVNGGGDGAVDLTISGGSTLYTILWDHGPVTEDINGLVAGTYCVLVTEAGGCSDSACITINEPAPISCDRPNTVVGTHDSGSNLTICWTPGDPGSHVDKVQIQMRRKPNQPNCPFDNGNRLANPADAPNNCVNIPFDVSNCDCFYQARVRYRCVDGNFTPWKFDVSIPTNCGAVRLSDEAGFQPFRVYPNPVSNIINIDYVPWQNGKINVALFDILGKKKIDQEFEVIEGDNQLKIDVSQLTTGAYLVEIKEGMERYTAKIVVE